MTGYIHIFRIISIFIIAISLSPFHFSGPGSFKDHTLHLIIMSFLPHLPGKDPGLFYVFHDLDIFEEYAVSVFIE